MKRQDFHYFAIALLLLGSLHLTISGVLMDRLGLHHLAFHNYVGYAWAILAFCHLSFSWGHVQSYVISSQNE
jgi:hypothetical protein